MVVGKVNETHTDWEFIERVSLENMPLLDKNDYLKEKVFRKYIQTKNANISLSYVHHLFDLIPSDFGNTSSGFLKGHAFMNILSYPIETLQLKVEFLFPDEIEHFLKSNYSNVHIYHSSVPFLNAIENKPKFPTQIHFNNFKSTLEVGVLQNGNLLLYNLYEVKTKEDVMYFLCSICEQLEIDPKKVGLFYYGRINHTSAALLMVQKFFANVFPGEEKEEVRKNFTLWNQIAENENHLG